ncbi:hypothetical protein HK097_001245 [Rhizophlyctis rosea]|uniref:Uncharacterized protein n=1 Tax=Rhizophlyctis rosea TaxID=64517 RepID=A0AAD5X7G6_9FUNG|nr:hypothetical protein HK097_001245 [Rhizophlyctis rosea]
MKNDDPFDPVPAKDLGNVASWSLKALQNYAEELRVGYVRATRCFKGRVEFRDKYVEPSLRDEKHEKAIAAAERRWKQFLEHLFALHSALIAYQSSKRDVEKPVNSTESPTQTQISKQGRQQRRKNTRLLAAHLSETSELDQAISDFLLLFEKDGLDAGAALKMEEESLADYFFDRTNALMAERRRAFKAREAPRLLLYLARNFHTRPATEIAFPEEVRQAARNIKEMSDIELTRELVMGMVAIRRFLEAIGRDIPRFGAQKDLNTLFCSIASHPVAGLFRHDARFSSFNGHHAFHMKWLIAIRKEVGDVAKLDFSKLADQKLLHNVSFVSEGLVEAAPDMINSHSFIACLTPKLQILQRSTVTPMKRSAYCRIMESFLGKVGKLGKAGDFGQEICSKGLLMMVEEKLDFKNVVLDPAQFLLSILDYPWPKSPSVLYRLATSSFVEPKALTAFEIHCPSIGVEETTETIDLVNSFFGKVPFWLFLRTEKMVALEIILTAWTMARCQYRLFRTTRITRDSLLDCGSTDWIKDAEKCATDRELFALVEAEMKGFRGRKCNTERFTIEMDGQQCDADGAWAVWIIAWRRV